MLLAFIPGSALAVPAVSTDRELSIITEWSALELELDAKITNETTKREGPNLGAVLLIESELLARTVGSKTPDVLPRVNVLKHLLTEKDERNIASFAQKNDQLKEQLVPISKKEGISSSGSDSDGPVLNGIEIDKVSIDVSSGPQTVTFTLDISDETGIDWARSCLCINTPGGDLIILRSTESNGVFTLDLSSSDPSGRYLIGTVQLYDTIGNRKIYGQNEIASLGFPGPTFVYLIVAGDETTNLTLTTKSEETTLIEKSEASYSLVIQNLASYPTGQLTIELNSANVQVSAVSDAGSSVCRISSVNYVSTVLCVFSGVDANASKILNLSLVPGAPGIASFNSNIAADLPDVSYLNNYISVSFIVDPDGDADGIADKSDNCPSDSNSDQLDKDSDGNGNACDIDDDNDGVIDSEDAFPLDATESKDTDDDGVGDNSDVFPSDASESKDADLDEIGDNADNCPNLENTDQLNTDGDLEGDACDLDDDNDGFTDEEELADGTNPLSRFSCKSGCFSFDVDENKEAKALSDGLLVIRHLFGFSGDSLTNGATTAEGARTSAEAISSYLSDADSELDIDGDGQSRALTDGLLLIRYLFGFSGDSLTAGAIGEGAERSAASVIEKYISDRLPSE